MKHFLPHTILKNLRTLDRMTFSDDVFFDFLCNDIIPFQPPKLRPKKPHILFAKKNIRVKTHFD